MARMSFSKIRKWILSIVLIYLVISSVVDCKSDKEIINELDDDIIEIEEKQIATRKRIAELQGKITESSLNKDDVPKDESSEDTDIPDTNVVQDFVERLDNLESNIEAIQSYVDGERETDTFLNGLRGDIGKAFDDDMLHVKNLAKSMRDELKTSYKDVDVSLKAVEDFANSRNVIIGGVLYYDGIGTSCGNSFDVCRVENSECRDGKCQCKKGLSHDSLQETCVETCADGYGSTYQTVNNYIIRGHNSVSKNETLLKECKALCETSEDFECRSLDYFPEWKACYLSDVVKGDVDDEAWEYNSAGIHFQRDCIVDKQTEP